MWPFKSKWLYLGWTGLKWTGGTDDIVHFWGKLPDLKKRKITSEGHGLYHLHDYYKKYIIAWLNDQDGDVRNVIFMPSGGLQNWAEEKYGCVWRDNKWVKATEPVTREGNVVKFPK